MIRFAMMKVLNTWVTVALQINFVTGLSQLLAVQFKMRVSKMSPIETKIGLSERRCSVACTNNKSCKAINYNHRTKECELLPLDMCSGASAELEISNGYSHYHYMRVEEFSDSVSCIVQLFFHFRNPLILDMIRYFLAR